MTKTTIKCETWKDGKLLSTQTADVNTDNPAGFHGTVHVKLVAGKMVNIEQMKESLDIKEELDNGK